MPRDSAGDYTLPNGSLVATGDTILVSQHNPPLQDIEQALSGSLDRDGKGGMRASLNAGGFRMTNLAAGVADTDAATVAQLGNTTSVPIGAVVDYWGAAPPSGYLFAAGQAVSRFTYSTLFSVIGTVAGAGNGSTTFNLPDYRGRVGAGKEDMATPATTRLNTLSSTTLGAVGGSQTHTLVTGEIPAHSHTVTDPGHSHTLGTTGSPGAGVAEVETTVTQEGGSYETTGSTTGITIANAGGGGAHNNVQPTIICNKIIRVS